MAKHEVVVNRLTSNDLSTIKVGVVESYEEELHYSDFSDDDLINKRALDEKTAGLDPYIPIQFLMPAGRTLPYTVGTDLTNTLIVTTYLCLAGNVRKISSQEYDLNMSGASTDFSDIQTITLYGHDDGYGNNVDDLWVVISKG